MTTNHSIIPEATFLDELRQATADSHTRLESLPISAKLVNPSLLKDDYCSYLSLMSGVITASEIEVLPMISQFIPDAATRLKSHLIKADLQKLDSSIPVPSFDFNPRSTAFAFGMYYVVEGSTLGGRYILKNVTAALGISEESGASYFAGYGNATGSMWKKFLNAMTEYATISGQYDEITAGAKFAFDSIHNHFDKVCR